MVIAVRGDVDESASREDQQTQKGEESCLAERHWRGVVWCGVMWCGVVGCSVVSCGVVWWGVVWCGVVLG